ncbi:MAG: 16S rRNA (cytosine(1402)-N(4))-methyltransferase RsmH, partial [Planctomycetota bacterium]
AAPYSVCGIPMTVHIPVLAAEIMQALDLHPGQVAVDGTLGGGGHTRLFAEAVGASGRVFALDRDPQAVAATAPTLPANVTAIHANYAELPEVLSGLQIPAVDAILLDLGLSSDQLADSERGFSFRAEGELDLRFDPTRGQPAWALLERIREEELANLIYEYGEERKSRLIARRICEARRVRPIRLAPELADLVRSCVPRSRKNPIDPATRTFQALRIAVNEELKWLEQSLAHFPQLLRPGGKLAIISFHSLEDRLVKHRFREHPLLEVLTKKPILAGAEELLANSRSRSAKLRIARRVGVKESS